jgi:hypothetical protein
MITFTGLLPLFLGYFYYCPILIFESNAAIIETSILPVQFYYRYYTLKKEKSPSIIRTLLWLIFSLSFCSIPSINIFSTFCPTKANPELIDYGPNWYSEVTRDIGSSLSYFLGANTAAFSRKHRELFRVSKKYAIFRLNSHFISTQLARLS